MNDDTSIGDGCNVNGSNGFNDNEKRQVDDNGNNNGDEKRQGDGNG